MFLFGSRARGDHEAASDTDLLIVCDEPQPRHVSVGKVSMFFYPWQKLLADAAHGDLFAGHVALEGKPISDEFDQLRELRRTFRLRSSYAPEVSHALDLGWFIYRFPEALRPSLAAKRMIWCVRTILIARSAENGKPIFAPGQLAKIAQSSAGGELLSMRRRRRLTKATLRLFQRFLLEEGRGADEPRCSTPAQFIDRFVQSENGVALRTLRQNEKYQHQLYS
ncbi:MAG: nucleotidyltransferase domain-containing protein [Enhydrobacter sp.]|nr:nucleotidyltransferase domain-containing protein [Enhydrobacter sp.]